jgi:glycosyltransferase involved in cell wall biosynthesis
LLSAVEASPDVTLLIAGRGEMEGEIAAAAARAKNIRWLGWLPITEVPLYSKLADVIYCCANPRFAQVRYGVPNKLFEAFMAGRAILARRGVGEMGDILERIPAGLLLDEVTPQTLQEAFQKLRDPLLLKPLQEATSQGRAAYNWAVAERRLLDLYAELSHVQT